MNIGDINRAIINGNFSNEELTSIIDAVKFARGRVATLNKCTIKIGQMVEFNSRKLGGRVQGKVVKILQKNVVLDCGARGSWRVPASMLEV